MVIGRLIASQSFNRAAFRRRRKRPKMRARVWFERSFNRAAFRRRRKPAPTDEAVAGLLVASIEPPSGEGGNLDAALGDPATADLASIEPPSGEGGNGRGIHDRHSRRAEASIEPPSGEGGNDSSVGSVPRCGGSFNRAAFRRRRKLPRSARTRRWRTCFNRAAFRRRRKPCRASAVFLWWLMLQ